MYEFSNSNESSSIEFLVAPQNIEWLQSMISKRSNLHFVPIYSFSEGNSFKYALLEASIHQPYCLFTDTLVLLHQKYLNHQKYSSNPSKIFSIMYDVHTRHPVQPLLSDKKWIRFKICINFEFITLSIFECNQKPNQHHAIDIFKFNFHPILIKSIIILNTCKNVEINKILYHIVKLRSRSSSGEL